MPKSKRSRWLGDDHSDGVERVRALPYDVSIPDLESYSRTVQALDHHWREVESSWKVDSAPAYARLVVPTGNAAAAIHRWFHFKEAYSKDLLPRLVADHAPADQSSMVLVDPFAGVGTTLLSALEMSMSHPNLELTGFGIEVNPFLQFVGSTKLGAATGMLSASIADLEDVLRVAKSLASDSVTTPQLSTFQNKLYFPAEHVSQLTRLRAAVALLDPDSGVRSLAQMALAMTVEPASRLRRDGRALRYEARVPLAPFEVFARAARRIVGDLPAEPPALRPAVDISLQSVVAPWDTVPVGGCDVIVFSPPYPNNIDYTEVYKTELWALGFVDTRDGFRAQRHETLRSHPSVKFTRELRYNESPAVAGEVEALLRPLIAAISAESRYAGALEDMIRGYTDDMLTTLRSAHAALKPGGLCIYVVGNSVHGTKTDPVMIASDLIIARVGEMSGFEVQELRVARALPRRKIDSPYVRETVGILRRAD